MRIVALVKSLDNACCRYRLAAYRPMLEQAGHSLRLLPWPKSFLPRLLLRRQLRGTDVLILQRKMPAPWELETLRTLTHSLIFDFDDAVLVRDTFDGRGAHCGKRARRFRRVVQAADWVVAGNGFLREQASLWVEPARIRTIPTCVDLERYQAADQSGPQLPELVWIGSASTLRGLRQIRPLLEDVGARLPGLRLKIICDAFPHLNNIEIHRCQWSEATEAHELAGGQIGFSWLPDDLWGRGKCGLKVLQYMAAGLPVIANPVGIHRDLVIPGETGFMVETAEEMAAAIRSLTNNADLRQRLGRNGRERMRRSFDVSRGAELWLDLLGQLANRTTDSRRSPSAERTM